MKFFLPSLIFGSSVVARVRSTKALNTTNFVKFCSPYLSGEYYAINKKCRKCYNINGITFKPTFYPFLQNYVNIAIAVLKLSIWAS